MQSEPDSRPGAPQIAIVLKDGQWFIRRLAYTVQDDIKGEMVYHCDENLGGPFAAWSDVANAVDAYLVSVTTETPTIAWYKENVTPEEMLDFLAGKRK